MVIHLSYMYNNKYGGYNTTTLCRREHKGEEINSTENINLVTCKCCLQCINNNKAWQWRKYLKDNIK